MGIVPTKWWKGTCSKKKSNEWENHFIAKILAEEEHS